MAFVYVAQGPMGTIKIGRTIGCPIERVRTLGCYAGPDHSARFKLIGVKEFENAADACVVESTIVRSLASERVGYPKFRGREWYRPTERVKAAIADFAPYYRSLPGALTFLGSGI